MDKQKDRKRPVSDRFWSKVEKTSTCWLWRGAKSSSGYGWFTANWERGPELAHRVAFRLTHGHDAGPETCHSCDVRLCVQPEHLSDGDHAQNMREAVERGRHGQAKKTHCRNGHPFDDAYVYAGRGGWRERQCRICSAKAKARWRENNPNYNREYYAAHRRGGDGNDVALHGK